MATFKDTRSAGNVQFVVVVAVLLSDKIIVLKLNWQQVTVYSVSQSVSLIIIIIIIIRSLSTAYLPQGHSIFELRTKNRAQSSKLLIPINKSHKHIYTPHTHTHLHSRTPPMLTHTHT